MHGKINESLVSSLKSLLRVQSVTQNSRLQPIPEGNLRADHLENPGITPESPVPKTVTQFYFGRHEMHGANGDVSYSETNDRIELINLGKFLKEIEHVL